MSRTARSAAVPSGRGRALWYTFKTAFLRAPDERISLPRDFLFCGPLGRVNSLGGIFS